MNLEWTSIEAYEKAFSGDPTATFFQSPAWFALAAQLEGGRTRFLVHPDGAVLPLLERGQSWRKRLCGAFGTYTGWLKHTSTQSLGPSPQAMLSLRSEFLVSPFCEGPRDLPGSFLETHVTDLSDWNSENSPSHWNRNHRRSLRTFRESEISIRLGEVRDLPGFLELYALQIKSWGERARRRYPDALFHGLLKETPQEAVRFWIAENEGRIRGARWCFHQGTHAVEWLAVADLSAKDSGVNHGLIHHAMAMAAQRGCRHYDFNPNPGLPGVDHFKDGFRSERRKVPWVQTSPIWQQMLRRWKSASPFSVKKGN
jgi:hypothetical protein